MICVSLIYVLLVRESASLPLPPGPKPLPLIGNLHQLRGEDQWKRHEEWHGKYGPIISVKMGLSTVIMISNYDLANELLGKRAATYSSRPKMRFLNMYLTDGLQPVMMPFGPQWKCPHRLHMMLLNSTSTKAYRHLQDLESKQFLYELLTRKKDSHTKHFTRFTVSLMTGLMFGERTMCPDEEEPRRMRECLMKRLSSFHWSCFLPDLFPFLDWIPAKIAPWYRIGRRVRAHELRIYQHNINMALQRKPWCWSKELTERGASQGLTSEQICYVINELFMAGTTGTIVGWDIFVAMALIYPECVRQAQDELDAVVGEARQPTLEDRPRLPYVCAFLNELLRFRPILPTRFPHASTQDDEYMGYKIPKDAAIIANTWLMDSDQAIYSDPHVFRPERWLECHGLPITAFGFGRRKCPGQALAQNSLFMAISRCLWGFEIMPDSNGPDSLVTSSIIAAKGKSLFELPDSVNACFKIRSPRHEDTIITDWYATEKDLDKILAVTKDEIPILKHG